jgi:hypothetical protein
MSGNEQGQDQRNSDAKDNMLIETLRYVGAQVGVWLDVPGAVKRNLAKAVHHLARIPIAKINGRVAEENALSDARAGIIRAAGMALIEDVSVDPILAQVALETAAHRIIRGQANANRVIEIACEDLRKEPYLGSALPDDISDDWLNAFEREAREMSSPEMQMLYGKILAGEICKPGAFSRRTIKLMAQLDNSAAEAFRRACSLATAIVSHGEVVDARVISVGQSPGRNGLAAYGLSFNKVSLLVEYGLIIPAIETEMTYGNMIVDPAGTVRAEMRYQGKNQALLPHRQWLFEEVRNFKVSGLQFTQAGMELLDVVPLEPEIESYRIALHQRFMGYGLSIVNATDGRVEMA